MDLSAILGLFENFDFQTFLDTLERIGFFALMKHFLEIFMAFIGF